jgi:hypothetical protein
MRDLTPAQFLERRDSSVLQNVCGHLWIANAPYDQCS